MKKVSTCLSITQISPSHCFRSRDACAGKRGARPQSEEKIYQQAKWKSGLGSTTEMLGLVLLRPVHECVYVGVCTCVWTCVLLHLRCVNLLFQWEFLARWCRRGSVTECGCLKGSVQRSRVYVRVCGMREIGWWKKVGNWGKLVAVFAF